MMGEARQGLKFSGEGSPSPVSFTKGGLAGQGVARLGKAGHGFFN